jgi:hypothetical protein
MMIVTRATMTQRLGRIVVAGVVALLLVGTVATTAEALPRRVAQGYIDLCFDTGGDPLFFDFGGVWAVGCRNGDDWTVDSSDGSHESGSYDGNLTAPFPPSVSASNVADHGRHKSHKHHKYHPHTCKRC